MYNSTNKTNKAQLLKSKLEVVQEQNVNHKNIIRLLAAQDKERAKIGQEIQENLNQILIATLLYIELAKTDDESREMCLERSSALISTVIKGLTDLSRTLAGRDISVRVVNW